MVLVGTHTQSQTLYTMGVKDTKMMSVPDSNFTIYMQNNPDTRDLRMGERIFVGRRVYNINFIDDVSRAGLINYLLSEDTISPYDNEEEGIADYYKYYDKDDDITNHIDTPEKPKILLFTVRRILRLVERISMNRLNQLIVGLLKH